MEKEESLGSVDLDNLDSMEMNDILKYTNINKRPKLKSIPKTNKQISTLLTNTPNSIISTGTITNTNTLSQSNTIESTNNTSVTENIFDKLNINNTPSNGRTNNKPMRTIDSIYLTRNCGFLF